jgi:hypothetical protein
VYIELNNKELLEDVLIKEVDPFSMTFIVELEDRDRVIQMRKIFTIDKMKEGKAYKATAPESQLKDYNAEMAH